MKHIFTEQQGKVDSNTLTAAYFKSPPSITEQLDISNKMGNLNNTMYHLDLQTHMEHAPKSSAIQPSP